MKTATALLLAALVAQAAAYARQGFEALAPAAAPAAAPAGGPAAGPAASIAALRVTYEIKNYNYYDLTKKTCPEAEGQVLNAVPKGKGKKLDIVRKPAHPGFHKAVEDIANGIEDITRPDGEKPEPPPWMEGKEGASLLESDKAGVCVIDHNSLAAMHTKSDGCQTIMEVFRSAIKEVVRDVIKCSYLPAMAGGSSPAPAVAAAPAAFLQAAPAGPAAAPVAATAGPPDVSIFVTFSPGREIGAGKSVNVEITFTDKPENGVDDVAVTNKILQYAMDNGLIKREMKAALEILTNITPKLTKIKKAATAVEAWNVKKCEGHVRSIVESFATYYTREHVPMAMYNECTNFITRMSFSHDYVLDAQDTTLCRKTTAQFAKHWNYGEKAKPEDFQLMCVRACEAKFGNDAPQCNIEAGQKLLGKPI